MTRPHLEQIVCISAIAIVTAVVIAALYNLRAPWTPADACRVPERGEALFVVVRPNAQGGFDFECVRTGRPLKRRTT